MARPAARIILLQVVMAIAAVVIIGRSAQVQLLQHAHWHGRAEQRKVTRQIVPRRGTIYDRNGAVLANSEQQFHLSITVRELEDTAGMIKRLPKLLGVTPERVRKEFEGEYPYFGGPYTAEQIASIRKLRGVHPSVVYRRVYPHDSTAVALIGSLNAAGSHGLDGIEASLDSLLSGSPGEERPLKDAAGRILQSPGTVIRDPVPGRSVYLTIDRELQGIAEADLLKTILEHQAEGGDFVVYEVATGEILAAASFRLDPTTGRMRRSASAITEGYEPGSTAKLFTAAAILIAGSDTTPVSGECGKWDQHVSANYTRHIEDVHHSCELLGLGSAIKFSSNIAMTKFALRLDDSSQYVTMRNFGIGTPLGLGFQNEESGLLYPPSRWDNPLLAKPSMAMGYYMRATTTHLVAAFAAIGNHGFLLAPAIVKEVRTSSDSVMMRHAPVVLRRAIPDSVAAVLMGYLREVTGDGGTGLKAQLDDSSVAGKTGTAVVNVGKKGEAKEYRASFVGLQPADHPRIAFTAMIYRPKGEIYGGAVAAPLIRSALQSMIAMVASPIARKATTVQDDPGAPVAEATVEHPERSVRFPLGAAPVRDSGFRPIPALAGSSIRDATFALHQLGFAVKLVGRGRVRTTLPAAGDSLPRGSLVTIRADSMP